MGKDAKSGKIVESEATKGKKTRREALRSFGATAGILVGLSTTTQEVKADNSSNSLESFRVKGTEIVTTHIEPEQIRVQRRCISPDLKRRYGDATLDTTKITPRPDNQDDGLPDRDTKTVRRSWDTYYAKEDEWVEYYSQQESDNQSIGINALSKPSDCPKWYFENANGGFERKGPMNLAADIDFINLNQIVNVLTRSGWTDNVVQENRFAWVPQNFQFEKQHRSAATSTYRIRGGYHAKFWRTGSYITGTAHEDSTAPHHAVSFNSAEFRIVNIFQNDSNAGAIKNYYDFNNGGYLDHGGLVSDLY